MKPLPAVPTIPCRHWFKSLASPNLIEVPVNRPGTVSPHMGLGLCPRTPAGAPAKAPGSWLWTGLTPAYPLPFGESISALKISLFPPSPF